MAGAITTRQARATRADQRAPAKHRRGGLERAKARTGLLLVAPAFLFVAVFVLIPVGFAVYLSFTNYPLIGPDHWVGLQNWVSVGQDATFVQSVLFTLEYTAIVTPAIFLVGYGLAVLVRRRRRGSALLRTLFFLPYVVGLVTESFLLLLELQPGSGGVNAVLCAACTSPTARPPGWCTPTWRWPPSASWSCGSRRA